MRQRSPRRRLSAIGAHVAASLPIALALTSPARAAADDAEGPAAVPYRPSVSTPAALSAPGWLEIEGGFLHEHEGGDDRRESVPATLKLAFTPDWGLRVGADAWVHHRDETGSTSGYGDTSVVVKRRFALSEQQAFGLEAAATFATSRHGLGASSGKTDYGVNAIYSADFADTWHTDVNVVATRLGTIDAGAARTQWLGAASLTKMLSERWGIAGELSGTTQRGGAQTEQLLLAASYNVSKRLVLDAGAARSLRSGPPVWSAFTGFTWTALRLF